MADQSFLVKIVLNMHHECSQADVAQNSVNRSHNEQIGAFKQTDGWPGGILSKNVGRAVKKILLLFGAIRSL